jgi:hypothetical protein
VYVRLGVGAERGVIERGAAVERLLPAERAAGADLLGL